MVTKRKTKDEENDEKLILLKKKVEDKKASIKASQKFSPKTNCSVVWKGERINLRVESSKDKLLEMLVSLNSLRLSAIDLGVLEQAKYDDFSLQDLFDDVQSRLNVVDIKNQEAELKVLQDKLHNLLTVGKKVELEIDELEKLI